MCPQIVYCSVVLIIMKLRQVFINSLSSQVIITLHITEKNIHSKNIMSFIGTINKLNQKEKFRTFCHKKAKWEWVINTSKQKLLTIDPFKNVLLI